MRIEPTNIAEAAELSERLYKSGVFPHPNAASILSVILAGGELGLPPMAALRTLHLIGANGRYSIAPGAHALVAIVRGRLKPGEYIKVTSHTDREVTVAGKRDGEPEVTVTWSLDNAKKAGLSSPMWGKYPRNMLTARAQSELVRLLWPDIVAGMYSAEEVQDMRGDLEVAAVVADATDGHAEAAAPSAEAAVPEEPDGPVTDTTGKRVAAAMKVLRLPVDRISELISSIREGATLGDARRSERLASAFADKLEQLIEGRENDQNGK